MIGQPPHFSPRAGATCPPLRTVHVGAAGTKRSFQQAFGDAGNAVARVAYPPRAMAPAAPPPPAPPEPQPSTSRQSAAMASMASMPATACTHPPDLALRLASVSTLSQQGQSRSAHHICEDPVRHALEVLHHLYVVPDGSTPGRSTR